MKKVGYPPQTAAAIEAAASTGGQIMPPIMGAGAFIMAEITGIPYADIVIAAVHPVAAVLPVRLFHGRQRGAEAAEHERPAGRSELPEFRAMASRPTCSSPLVILIGGLVVGYSVIRAGTLGDGARWS